MAELSRIAHLHFDLLITALPLCISSYRFELWVPLVHIERHWFGMHIMILSLNGALPLYNTIIAYVLDELSKAQISMPFDNILPNQYAILFENTQQLPVLLVTNDRFITLEYP